MMVCSPILALLVLAPFFVRDPGFVHPSVRAKADAKTASAFTLRTPTDVSDASEIKMQGGRTAAPSQSIGHMHVNTSEVMSAGGASPGSSPPASWLAGQVHDGEYPHSITWYGSPAPQLEGRVLAAAGLGEVLPSPDGFAKAERHLQLRANPRTFGSSAAASRHMRGTTHKLHFHVSSVLNILPKLLGLVAFVALLLMVPGGPAANRARLGRVPDPPAWGPERESRYPFRHWIQDLLVWGILAVDMDPGQQAAAVINRLEGEARNVTREMSYAEMTTGGILNGVAVDPVTYLLSHLAVLFAPLGEESRLTAMGELMNFHRNSNESIDQLLARFRGVRWRAQQGGGNMTMNWEGYSWLILKACSPNPQQLITILQPIQGRFPSTEVEFEAMTLTLRRMGHVLENTYGNIASQLRTPPTRNFFGWESDGTQPPEPRDPWAGGNDPWSAGTSLPSAAAQPVGTYVVPTAAGFEHPYYDDLSGTDTDTISSTGEPDYADPQLAAMTPAQQDEHLYWQYQSAKSNWRKHMHKPARRVRRFFKRKGKGKGGKGGKSKGAQRFAFLSDLSDEEYDHVFYGGKGKSKGKRRSSGKGKGRKRNPIGKDGEVMRCSFPTASGQVCNSDSHFRAQCPHNTQHQSGSSSFGGFAAPVAEGPLGDLLGGATPVYMLQETATPIIADNASAATPAVADPVVERPAGIWQIPVESTAAAPPSPDLFFHPAGTPVLQPLASAQSLDAATVASHLNRMVPHDLSIVATLLLPHTLNVLQNSSTPFFPRGENTHSMFPRPNGTSENQPAHAPGPQETLFAQRMAIVQGQLATRVAPAAGFGSLDTQMMELPQLASFRQLGAHYDRHDRWQAGRPTQTFPTQPAWGNLRSHDQDVAVSSGPRLPTLTQDLLPPSFGPLTAGMMQHQATRLDDLRSERARDQQTRAREFARRFFASRVNADPADIPVPDDAVDACQICQDTYLDGELVSHLVCSHRFHSNCIDAWVAHSTQQNVDRSPPCPSCRTAVAVLSIDARRQEPSVSSSDTYQSVASNFPWWPVNTPVELAPAYHASTQLPSGKLSLIVDPGAWTNLMGKVLARRLIQRAIASGHKPKQEKISPIHVAGVGKGHQQCDWKVECPITITNSSNQTSLHKITTPIVEGPGGEELPGLLGLRTLESERAILDTGNRRLYLPGPGEVQIVLPPGSLEVPLEKAPSGHLVMVIDEYERLVSQKGGVEDVSLTLHATPPNLEQFNQSQESDVLVDASDDPPSSAPAACSSGRNFSI